MAKEKKEEKKEKQAQEKSTSVPKKEVSPKKEPLPKKGPTLKEKIDRTVDDHVENPDELKKQIFGLVQRVLYPDQFCPDCDDRLFLSGQTYNCTNCGFQRALNNPVAIAPVTPSTPSTPGARPSETGTVPKQVEDMISKANKDMKGPSRGGTTPIGTKIQKLVAQRDAGGPQEITSQDESAVRRDGNVSNKINWV